MEKKRVLICGAGCIGIFLGAKLHKRGHEVYLFGRRKLGEMGDEVYIRGEKMQIPNKIFSLPKNEKFDFIFITSKLYDLEKVIRLINRHKLSEKFAASIQNGLVDNSKYKKLLGRELIPICVFGGFQINGNKIIDNSTKIGWKTEPSKAGKEISKVIYDAGVLCKADKKFDSLRAEKTIVNCCLNALCAIEKKSFKQLFENQRTRERIGRLFDECYNVLTMEHSLESSEKIKQRMFNTWKKMNHYSSTYQDAISGRKTETKFFNGFICELGKKYKLKTPENKKIMEEFKEVFAK